MVIHNYTLRFTALFLIMMLAGSLEAKPRWVKMMDKSTANYFKAVKRYERYWERHFLPNSKEEHEGSKKEQLTDPRPWIVQLVQSEEKAREKSNKLSMEFKKFRKWKLEMLPYVKSDGKIMSPEERLEAWKQIQNQ